MEPQEFDHVITMKDLRGVFDALVETRSLHGHSTKHYQFLKALCHDVIANSEFRNASPAEVPFGPFGDIVLPYFKMGAIDSIDLFGLDELIIFAFYNANRHRYKRTIDIGANLGLHSILMARCGYSVTAYEPDPIHFELLKKNLVLNAVRAVSSVMAAVSDHEGTMEFVRVKGNTTGSHLAGAKANPYGDLERFSVAVASFSTATRDADFAKIDAEGHEFTILRSLPVESWRHLDAIVEVGTLENAIAIFEYFRSIPVTLFAQKIGWAAVERLADMPISHREGSLFVTSKRSMPWG